MKHYKITFKHSEDKKLKAVVEVDAMNERQALDFAYDVNGSIPYWVRMDLILNPYIPKHYYTIKVSSGIIEPTSHLESDPLSFGGQW